MLEVYLLLLQYAVSSHIASIKSTKICVRNPPRCPKSPSLALALQAGKSILAVVTGIIGDMNVGSSTGLQD